VGALALTPVTSAQSLYIVDPLHPFSGSTHASIQSAINTASNGDFILVRSGSYSSITIDGEGLVIFEDNGATVDINGSITVRNMTSTQRTVLRGIDSHTPAAGDNKFQNCASGTAIWVEDCTLSGQKHGLEVTSCHSVILTHSTFRGGAGTFGDPGSGVRVDSDMVSLWDSTAEASNQTATSAAGGDGITIGSTGDVFASGCTFSGGKGGPGGVFPTCSSSGVGGDGGHVEAGGILNYSAVTFTAGAGGSIAPFCSGTPTSGSSLFVDPSGSATGQTFPAYGVTASDPVQYGSSVFFTVYGVSGDAFDVRWSATPLESPLSLPYFYGKLLLAATVYTGFTGTVPGNSSYSEPSGSGGKIAYIQGIFVDSVTGVGVAGAPTTAIYHQ
jgi:hypothetical protein